MKKTKVVFVLDYIKVHYFNIDSQGNPTDRFFSTDEGKKLAELLKDAFKSEEVDIHKLDIKILYAYNAIPEIIRENKRNPSRNVYDKVGASKLNEYKPLFYQNLVEENPDIVIPMGGHGVKFLLDKTAISKLRGLPTEVLLDHKPYTVLPIFSPNYVLANPAVLTTTQSDMRLLARFVRDGKEAFKPAHTKYKTFTNNFEELLAQIKDTLTHGRTVADAIAMDVETNSLNPYAKGAKILSVTISTEEKTGYTFPLYHPDYPWKPEQQATINELLKYMLTSDLYIVGHNFMYDTRMFKQTLFGDIVTKNIVDTMVAYYVSTNQEVKDSFTLKHLAIEHTDIGGYEQPLDDYKDWFRGIKKGTGSFLEKLVKVHNNEYELTDKDYLAFLTEEQRQYAINLGNEILEEFDWDVPTVHNVHDGGLMDYSWIPYDLLAQYASGDGDVTLRLHHKFYSEMIQGHEKLEKLFAEHYPALTDSLTRMEANGMYLLSDRLKHIRDDIYPVRMKELREEITEMEPGLQQVVKYKEDRYMEGLQEKAKKPAERDKKVYALYNKYRKPEDRLFKFGNADDLALLLFGIKGYKLPIDKMFFKDSAIKAIRAKKVKESEITWRMYSTGSKAIERLMEDYADFKELGQRLVDYSRYSKLSASFTDSLLDQADEDNLVHSTFKITGTNTSRLSSSEPRQRLGSL